MLKDFGIIKNISREIGEAASAAAKAIMADYTDLTGKEEEITPQLRGEINRHLMDEVKKRLNGKTFGNCKVTVATFKKKQESTVGADLAGILEIDFNGRKISKAYLAQAKVGKEYLGPQGQVFVRATNDDLQKQVSDMLEITSDSFVFIYSKGGIHCVPAFQVALSGTNSISTESFPFRNFGSFYEEFIKCFIGDHKIAPDQLGAVNLEDYAKRLTADAALKIAIKLPKK